MRTLLVLATAVAATLAVLFAADSGGPVRAQLGGPVIIGGDDMPDHGFFDGTNNVDGWLYMQKALENITSNVTRAGNDGSVAALGSAQGAGGAGDAIESAATGAGLSVTFHDGDTAINQFFSDLASGAINPAIIWIAGDGTGNDLDFDEGAALTTNALAIANFVNSGGGLMSHGIEYGWLFALLPGASTVDSGSSDDLYLTPDGQTAFPGLTDAEVNAGPWHNHFEGDFGGLQVLVRSLDVDDAQGNDAAVIIGGAQVIILPEGPFGNPTCSDQIDNDADGLIDAADPDCAPPPTPTPSPAPTPTPTPVALPVVLPPSGGSPADGAPILLWPVLAVGTFVLASAAGLTLAYQRRRIR